MTDTRDLDAAMLTVWKHGDWKTLTLYMTNVQREAAAQAVNRAGHTSPYVRWWNMTPAKAGNAAVESLCEAIGKPAPPAMTPSEREQFNRAMDDIDRQVADFYNHPERRAAPGPLVLRMPPPLPSESDRQP